MSGELKTRVEISGLYVKPFKSLVLEGLYVEDLEGDTLISSPKFTVDLNFLSFELRKISVNTLQMDNGKFYLKQYKDSTTNVEFIVNYFNTGTPKPVKKVRKPYDITFDKITLNNISFKYRNFNTKTGRADVVNFNDLFLNRLNITLLGLDTREHLAKAEVRNFTFHDKSGFYLKNLSAHATIDANRMEFNKLTLETPNTYLSDYVLMSFNDFKDFSQFISKVNVKAHLVNSRLDPRDISYFVPNIRPINMTIGLNGDISGYVNNIRARNFSVKAGRSTYLSGDFDIKGLPNANETFLSLKFDQVSSSKQDADYIMQTITGKDIRLPAIVNKFGNINFKGQFTGFPKDFIALGEFKTSLGRIVSDINMKIRGNVPFYSGTIKTYDFNIGELLDRKDLGRTTMTASVKGSSFSLNQLNESINSSIAYFDYKGYRYSNIKINGTFKSNLFNGEASVNDKNVKLDFKGSINLKNKVPEFNFTANVEKANLHALKLTKDTVQIEADIKTNFSGTNLDNIQGDLWVRKIRLTNPGNSFVVDSVQLSAHGLGDTRLLTINSDILDASLEGQYDLRTLPNYFKAIVKKYIPSLKWDNLAHGVQNFELKLKLKYFEPLSLLLIPELKIPDGATINGQFVSSQNIATLNGSAKLIEYKGVKIHDLILDETNHEQTLNVIIASNRIDFSDSLYVMNINISNIIRNDSLALNIKLSDKDATNQLDLNGLVEFATDTAISLSLLPSDVVINRETWKIQEQVRLKFDKGKTIIENFELFRDDQLITINGIVSNDPKDLVKLDFNKFKLSTLNSLTKGSGFTLRGQLNGSATIASILSKTPRIDAEIGIDSMMLNTTLIGDLKLISDLDNATKLVNVKMQILKGNEERLNLTGTYNANTDQNKLDMAVTMNNSDAIIFQPLLKKLVSNLQGTVSANLKVTGKLTDPQIDGKLAFNNAGMTVNYLKTPYWITDSVTIENSVIRLNNLVIRDIRNSRAIASGTVNMRNPNIPIINMAIIADNFMALNTTAKDNALYYGVAYGTGTFQFNGPTNNMGIDINAKTEAETVFNIPLNASETIKNSDFITFVAKDSSLTQRKPPSFKGLTMNLYLDVDENSTVNIFTDLGKLSGQGTADGLHLQISSLGDFFMYGDYLISKGEFIYTPNNIINRKFMISQGGSIRWTGIPTEAIINLNAVYDVRTSLNNLYSAAGRPLTDQRVVLAEAIMNLNGKLLIPKITFELNFPDDGRVRDELQSYLSDPDNQFLQALSLIVRRTFAAGSGDPNNQGIGTQSIATLTSAGTELAMNQLNNIIAQTLNSQFLDFTVRSFNDLSASVRLLNRRLLITGGLTDTRTELNEFSVLKGSQVQHDLEAQYLIKRDGTLTLKASNKLNNRNFLNPNEEYISAIGLVYRQEFDNFSEFFRMLFGKKRREEKLKEEQLKKEEDLKKQQQQQPVIFTPPIALQPAATAPVKGANAP